MSLHRWRETFLPLGAEINLERDLKGKCRGKLRELSPDCPVIVFRWAPLAILSCQPAYRVSSSCLESKPAPKKKFESQLDWWWINFPYLPPLPRLLCILVQNLFKRINLLVELQEGIRKSNFNGLQTRPVIGSDLLTLQVRQVLPKGSACASILSRNLERWEEIPGQEMQGSIVIFIICISGLSIFCSDFSILKWNLIRTEWKYTHTHTHWLCLHNECGSYCWPMLPTWTESLSLHTSCWPCGLATAKADLIKGETNCLVFWPRASFCFFLVFCYHSKMVKYST